MVARRFDMRTRSSLRAPAGRGGASATGTAGRAFGGSAAGLASALGAGAAAACGAGDGAGPPAARSTSRFITRPASPLPCTFEMSTSFCSAAFFAVGVARDLALLASAAASPPACPLPPGAGDAAEAPEAADSSMTPSTSPTLTSSPSLRSIRLNTPACGAPTSRSILSVSSSTRGSPAETTSPSLRSHLATRASTIDSPTSGTTMFAGIESGVDVSYQ